MRRREELSKRNDTAGTCETCTRFLARIAVRTADLYIYMYAYTRAHVCRVLWLRSCVFTAIDRSSSYTHLSTCHYTSGTSVLCTVTLVKMTVSANARGYITRPIQRNANNGRDCNRKPCISPLGWIQSVVAPFKAHFRSPLCLTTFADTRSSGSRRIQNYVWCRTWFIFFNWSSIDVKDLHYAFTLSFVIFIAHFLKIFL